MTERRILFLPKYGPLAASTRYRMLQYFPYLEKGGYACAVSPLLTDRYLAKRFGGRGLARRSALAGYGRRLVAMLGSNRYDAVIVHSEALPFVPAFVERLLLPSRIPVVLDLDDAVFHGYDDHPRGSVRRLLGNKIGNLMRVVACVFAGNRYLADYAADRDARAEIVPTVVDLTRYPAGDAAKRTGPLRIGWIGSPATVRYLREAVPALREFCRERNARVILIGSGNADFADLPVELVSWSEATEVDELQQCDVGIMPMADEAWARGKCGLKLLQYMACSLPVVATPTGVNAEIVTNDVNGYHARTTEEWIAALRRIDDDRDGARRMGAAGRKRVEDTYSLQVVAPRYVALIDELVGSRCAE